MRIRNLTILGLVAALAACGESTSSPDFDSDLLDIDVALVVADGVLSDLAFAAVMFDPPPPPPGRRGGHGQGEHSGTVTFLDANGNEQESMDDLTTATIIHSGTMTREASRDGWTASIEGTREQTITGLLGEETSRTLNGTGTEHVLRSRHSDEDGTRSYEMNSTMTWTDVVHGVPLSENPYPLSGSINRSMTIVVVNGPNGDETRSRTGVVTFDGTQFATLILDGESHEIDLSTRNDRDPLHRGDR